MKSYRVRQIIVPFDFSRLAHFALAHAVDIAKRSGARITLFHAIEPYIDYSGTYGPLVVAAAVEEDLRRLAIQELRVIGESVARRTGVRILFKASIDAIGPAITSVATKMKADLILMGTHGSRGFVGNILGSNAYHVAALSDIPVLSVHAGPLPKGIRHIVYLVRESGHATMKLPYALSLAKLFHARVHVVSYLRSGNNVESTKIRSLGNFVRNKFIKAGIETSGHFYQDQSHINATLKYASLHPGSLILIAQDQDFRLADVFHQSFPKKILQRSLAPVLTIPRIHKAL